MWTELRIMRYEGILVLSVYRVSKKKGAKTGPTTAYAQQINNMILEVNLDFGPRTQELIATKIRPILIMDTNDDWLQLSSNASNVFIEEMHLEYPLYNKFK